jgi:Cytochrome bd terminal oxidase subunit I
MLRGHHLPEARVMFRWGLGLVAGFIPVQMVFGHLTGEYVLHYQPEKFAAIEARWQTQQPATEVLLAIPDPWAQRNLFPIEVPRLGSFIASGDWTAKEIGLEAFPPADRPPVVIPFFAFRIMVGTGLIMVAISWIGVMLAWRDAVLSVCGLTHAPKRNLNILNRLAAMWCHWLSNTFALATRLKVPSHALVTSAQAFAALPTWGRSVRSICRSGLLGCLKGELSEGARHDQAARQAYPRAPDDLPRSESQSVLQCPGRLAEGVP